MFWVLFGTYKSCSTYMALLSHLSCTKHFYRELGIALASWFRLALFRQRRLSQPSAWQTHTVHMCSQSHQMAQLLRFYTRTPCCSCTAADAFKKTFLRAQKHHRHTYHCVHGSSFFLSLLCADSSPCLFWKYTYFSRNFVALCEQWIFLKGFTSSSKNFSQLCYHIRNAKPAL